MIIDEVNVMTDPNGSTEAVRDEYVATATPPPIADLSAFSSTPFGAQFNPDGSNPAVDSVAQDPAAVGIPQQVSVEADPGYGTSMAVSPFAAQAIPVVPNPGVGAMAIPPETPDLVDDQSLPVTVMTQQSTESVVDNAEWVSNDAGNQADYTAYDMDD